MLLLNNIFYIVCAQSVKMPHYKCHTTHRFHWVWLDVVFRIFIELQFISLCDFLEKLTILS